LLAIGTAHSTHRLRANSRIASKLPPTISVGRATTPRLNGGTSPQDVGVEKNHHVYANNRPHNTTLIHSAMETAAWVLAMTGAEV
jgi:hypothetical protein